MWTIIQMSACKAFMCMFSFIDKLYSALHKYLLHWILYFVVFQPGIEIDLIGIFTIWFTQYVWHLKVQNAVIFKLHKYSPLVDIHAHSSW